jgi:hypothetical protein
MRGSTAGLANGSQILGGKMTCHSLFLEILDTLFASFVVGPLVVTYWRGTWNLSDKFLLPHDKLHSSFASLVIGLIGHLIFTTFQGFLNGLFNPNEHRLTFYVGSRLYTSIFAVICVNTWRGGWQVMRAIDRNFLRPRLKSVLLP